MEELTEPDLPDYWLDIRHKACKAGKMLRMFLKQITTKFKSIPTLFCFAKFLTSYSFAKKGNTV
jgi:hypothetical protein